MTRRQRSRVVTLAGIVMLILLTGWSWYEHGWQRAAREVLVLMILLVVLFGIIEWEKRGEP